MLFLHQRSRMNACPSTMRTTDAFWRDKTLHLHAVEQWPEIKKRALRWRIDCESAVISGRHAGNFRLLLYEDLVSDPLVAVEDLFGWIGWEMDQQTVTFLMQSTGRYPPPTYARIFSKGYFGVYRRPGGNVTGWKTKISHQDYELMSTVLRDSPLLSFWPTHLTSKTDFWLYPRFSISKRSMRSTWY